MVGGVQRGPMAPPRNLSTGPEVRDTGATPGDDLATEAHTTNGSEALWLNIANRPHVRPAFAESEVPPPAAAAASRALGAGPVAQAPATGPTHDHRWTIDFASWQLAAAPATEVDPLELTLTHQVATGPTHRAERLAELAVVLMALAGAIVHHARRPADPDDR